MRGTLGELAPPRHAECRTALEHTFPATDAAPQLLAGIGSQKAHFDAGAGLGVFLDPDAADIYPYTVGGVLGGGFPLRSGTELRLGLEYSLALGTPQVYTSPGVTVTYSSAHLYVFDFNVAIGFRLDAWGASNWVVGGGLNRADLSEFATVDLYDTGTGGFEHISEAASETSIGFHLFAENWAQNGMFLRIYLKSLPVSRAGGGAASDMGVFGIMAGF
jgi:hypothetical protein